jgi:hypothetical protein
MRLSFPRRSPRSSRGDRLRVGTGFTARKGNQWALDLEWLVKAETGAYFSAPDGVLDRLKGHARPGESHSDVIIRVRRGDVRLSRYLAQPSPAKPNSIRVQVEDSGTVEGSETAAG